jgi:hypothetical protein
MRPRLAILLLSALLAALLTAVAAAPALGGMQSTKINRHLCATVGGGRFVKIRAFPGEYIDRRLIPDIRWMKRRFDIFITDGYSLSRIHSRKGEHPRGLALDIVPYWSRGGNWNKIGRLAHKAEPRRDRPRPPWRWVGYNGDANHGRGHHLHLSYMHSPTRYNDPARVVYTRKCPERRVGTRSATAATSEDGFSASSLEEEIAPAVPEKR